MSLSENGYRFARQMFKGAIELDPGFAQAHAGLADTDYFILQWHLDDANAGSLRAEALAASGEALRLDPDLAEAHVSRANVFSYSGRAEEAEVEFRRALSLNPALPHAHYFYARHLFGKGRRDEAAREFEETMRLEPDDYGTAALLVSVHKGRGNLARRRRGRRRDAQGWSGASNSIPTTSAPSTWVVGRRSCSGTGPRHGLLSRGSRLSPDDFSTLYNVACGYANAGELERALDALERAVGTGRGSRRGSSTTATSMWCGIAPISGILSRVKS